MELYIWAIKDCSVAAFAFQKVFLTLCKYNFILHSILNWKFYFFCKRGRERADAPLDRKWLSLKGMGSRSCHNGRWCRRCWSIFLNIRTGYPWILTYFTSFYHQGRLTMATYLLQSWLIPFFSSPHIDASYTLADFNLPALAFVCDMLDQSFPLFEVSYGVCVNPLYIPLLGERFFLKVSITFFVLLSVYSGRCS